jgi:hypothetical protein
MGPVACVRHFLKWVYSDQCAQIVFHRHGALFAFRGHRNAIAR